MSDTSALVSPFIAERFTDSEPLSALISPPYDVISPEDRRELVARHGQNIVRLILPDADGDPYQAARELLESWRRDGTVVRDPEPGVYVLQQRFTTPAGSRHTRTGLIAALRVQPYATGHVKPHEKTHKGPKVDRLALMRATRTMFESLFMLAPDPDDGLRDGLLSIATGAPDATADLDGVTVSLWSVRGSAARDLAETAGRHPVYIADGHHRYETAVAFRDENPAATHTLALIVPRGDPGLVVLPTYRILVGDGMDGARLRELLERSCVAEPLAAGQDPARVASELPGGCVVSLADGAYVVSERGDSTLPRVAVGLDPAVQHLNIARVDAFVVEPIRKATGGELRYAADPAAVAEAVKEGAVGVLPPATPVDAVIAVADAGGFMPQKSTYFQPKVPSGLVMMPVDSA